MFALIFDTRDVDNPFKRVISVHHARETAERALAKRMARLKKTVEECDTRIVWLKERAKTGDWVPENTCSTWRPGEPIPYGETHSDTD